MSSGNSSDKQDSPEKKRRVQKKGAPKDPVGAKNLKKPEGQLWAKLVLSGHATNLSTALLYSQRQFPDIDTWSMSKVMCEEVVKIKDGGDLKRAEAILAAQAMALDTIFSEMARVAYVNMEGNFRVSEACLRLALKAQTQSRSTLQTLAEIKNPRPVAFVKQANIAHGHQQVNNNQAGSRAEKSGKEQNELLETDDGERLDTGEASQAIEAHPSMEALGEIDRTKIGARQSKGG